MLAKVSFKNLLRNPRRTLASLITVMFGAAGLLIYQGFNSGIMNQYRENTIHGYFGYGQVFSKDYYGKVFEKPWQHWIENSEQTGNDLKSIPGVIDIFPRLSLFVFLTKDGINLAGRGEGVVPEKEKHFFNQMNFVAGDYLSDETEIILGKGLADSLAIHVGEMITLTTQTVHGQLNGADLRVAGIFHTGIKSIDDIYFRIHLSQAQRLLDVTSVESFVLHTTGVEVWPQVAQAIGAKRTDLQAVPFEILDKVYYQNSIDFLEAQFSFIRMIILVIVALGIFNTISVGMMERAGEVGALRANGETRVRLFKIFLIENLILGFLGGLIGVIIAIIIDKTILANGIPMPPGPGITRHFLILLEIQSSHVIQALILTMFTAVLASLWPVYKLLSKSIPELLLSN